MKKTCPNCNKQLPEEATFCLYCFTNLSDTDSGVAVAPKKTFNKKILSRTLIIAAFLVIAGISVLALKHSVSEPPLAPENTTVVTETQTVPATDDFGEAVTDEDGEQVFDTITVTKTQIVTTTEKQGFLDKIFNNETEENTSSESDENTQLSNETEAEETTQKQSWFDKLFGNNETEEETTTNPVTTSPEENNLQPTTEPSATVPATDEIPESTGSHSTDSTNNNEPSTNNGNSSTTGREPTAKPSDTTNSTTKPVSTTGSVSTTKPTTTTKPSTTTTTRPATTQPSTTRPVTTTEPVSTTAPEQDNNFTYTVVDGSIKLLGYTGNSSVVRVPSEIDGKHVAYLGSNVFSDKSNITSIIFEGTTSGSEKFYLPANTTVFSSLPNLTSVTFPFETNNYFINSDGSTNYTYSFGTLFSACPKVSAVNFGPHINSMHSSGMSRMYSTDGVVFVNTSSEISLLWYPVAKTQTDYTVPDNVRKIEKNAFLNNAYIQSITLSSRVSSVVGPNFRNCTKLSSFYVAEGNTKFFTENGVLYFPGFTINNVPFYGAFYPPAKADTAFSFLQDKALYLDAHTFCGNPNLKEITIFGISRIDGAILSSDLRPINLEKIVASKNCLIPSNAENLYTVEYFD